MPSRRRTRASNARSSSNENTLFSDSIGTEWRTSVSWLAVGPPTRCVGRIGRAQLRVGFLKIHELAEQRVVLGVTDLRRILLVVEPVGALDLFAQLSGAGWPDPTPSHAEDIGATPARAVRPVNGDDQITPRA